MNLNYLNGNWIDLAIIFVALFFGLEAFRVGFWVILSDFLSFILSLIVSLWGYRYVATFLVQNFSLPRSVGNALGFLITAVISEAVIGYLLYGVISKIPYKLWKNQWSKILSLVPAFGEAAILSAFILTLIISLPINPNIKQDVTSSKIGGLLVEQTSGIESKLNDIFGGVVDDALTYFTVEPGSNELIPLGNVDGDDLVIDQKAETEMFALINSEREKRGVEKLKWSDELKEVARTYANLMWTERFFGHVSPEGQTLEDRLKLGNIDYTFAGENLALAPTVATAHTGLMNSPGHKENILDPKFRKVGIGVVNNGYYGKMFVQEFTN
ncbi:hypothetical protein A2115_03735 [Candidatus Woesebacteria bacterium GWA1_41_8]|jgi:uncharacterized protein YkwD|uniref:SCP domain-containing protein n=1 Tax=Candidatus Woesebacteria bacterium GWA1_41_8 TaxID=1802471 RepID=A0A1F7WGJ7_9BACT|nr:MAG: hypothetical protein A2115_03735 [Candidatus Woesebacteria bacterium GWA1_41_8]